MGLSQAGQARIGILAIRAYMIPKTRDPASDMASVGDIGDELVSSVSSRLLISFRSARNSVVSAAFTVSPELV